MNTIYFDNAATSWPKPSAVTKAITDFLNNSGGNPGRSGHRLAMAAGDLIFESREALANLFGQKNPMHTIFTTNGTTSLNIAIKGLIKNKPHVIISAIEHNSVVRPLEQLCSAGLVDYSIWQMKPDQLDDLNDLQKLVRNNTSMIIINHSSNVNGMIMPVKEIGKYCNKHGIIFLVDAAQTAGTIPINMQTDCIDILAITGHKGLYGPPGTGALIINDNFDYRKITPLIVGGTGSLSSDFKQPEFLPDKLESGTQNGCGISGLLAGIKYINSIGIENIGISKQEMSDFFIETATKELGDYIEFHSTYGKHNSGVVSFNIMNKDSSELSSTLSDEFGIMSRSGLHCSPLAHKYLNTYPTGSLRFSFSHQNTKTEIQKAVMALKSII